MSRRILDEPTSEQIDSVKLILRQHNKDSNPEFWNERSLPENSPELIELVCLSTEETVLGGLLGSTQFSWLKIDIMSVVETHRGRGIGAELIHKAEEIALNRGCKYSYVDTMEYQAPEFYQKLGYKQVGQLPDWDSCGHKKMFFVKELDVES